MTEALGIINRWCDMDKILNCLTGGDLRSIGKVDQLVDLITRQDDFDKIFAYLHSSNRLIAMRASDVVEKLTRQTPQFLIAHKAAYIDLLRVAENKELKWHLAQLANRFDYTNAELTGVWRCLKGWTEDKKCSKIVRVNALQALYDLAKDNANFKAQFKIIVDRLKSENVPSINARIRKLYKAGIE